MPSSDVYTFGAKFNTKILALLCNKPTILSTYRDIIDPSYFQSHIHQTLCQAIVKISDYTATINSDTLLEVCMELVPDDSDEEREIYEQIISEIDEVNLDDWELVVDRLIDFAKHSALTNAVVEGADLIDKQPEDYGDQLQQLIGDAIQVGDDVLDRGSDPVDCYEEAIARIQNPESIDMVPTGLSHLDDALGGGARKGGLYIVLGPQKGGKSIALMNIAVGSARQTANKNVVYYSLEMQEDILMERFVSRMLKKTTKEIRELGDKAIPEYKKAQNLLGGQILFKQYPTKTASINTIKSHLNSLIATGFKPDVIIIDYSNIVKPRIKHNDKRHEYASIYEDMRALAGEYDVPVWSADQAVRGANNSKVIMSEATSESHEKTTICDFMASICQTQKEKLAGEARLYVTLNRNGAQDVVIDCRMRKDIALITTTNLREPDARDLVELEDAADGDSDKPRRQRKEKDEDPGRNLIGKHKRQKS